MIIDLLVQLLVRYVVTYKVKATLHVFPRLADPGGKNQRGDGSSEITESQISIFADQSKNINISQPFDHGLETLSGSIWIILVSCQSAGFIDRLRSRGLHEIVESRYIYSIRKL